MEIIKTLVYKGFGHLSTPETSEEFKKNLGIKNVLVYGSLIKKFAHHGLAGPYSIKFSFDGNIDYRIDKTFLRIKRNQYLFFNDGQQYECNTKPSTKSRNDSEAALNRSLVIFFSTKYFQRSVSSALETFDSCLDDPEFCRNTQYEFFQRICQSSPDTASLFHSLAKYVEMGNSFATEELLLSLIEKFLRDQASDVKRALSHSSKKVSTRVELYRRAALAFDYIHSSYSENLSLEQLASITHIAPFHLIRVFKEYFKITPYQLTTNLRLEKAVKLMQKTGMSISDISENIGYNNLSTFTRLFTKYHKKSPFYFRKEKRIISSW